MDITKPIRPRAVITSRPAQRDYEHNKAEHADVLTGLQTQALRVQALNQQKDLENKEQQQITRESEQKSKEQEQQRLESDRQFQMSERDYNLKLLDVLSP